MNVRKKTILTITSVSILCLIICFLFCQVLHNKYLKNDCSIQKREIKNTVQKQSFSIKTGAQVLGIVPSEIIFINVLINSGTAKGQVYNFTSEKDSMLCKNIESMFWGRSIAYSHSESSYPDNMYSLKITFYKRDLSSVDLIIFDEGTIKTNRNSDFYNISPIIDFTVFQKMVEANSKK